MRHLSTMTCSPAPAAVTLTPLSIKLNGVIQILDRLALAQLQSPWKAPFPIGGSTGTTGTTGTSGTNVLGG